MFTVHTLDNILRKGLKWQLERTRIFVLSCHQFIRDGEGRIDGSRSSDDMKETGDTKHRFAFLQQSRFGCQLRFDSA